MKSLMRKTGKNPTDRKEPANLYILASVVEQGREIARDFYDEELSDLVARLLKREIKRRKRAAVS